MKDYYEILGIDRDASYEVIKRVYRRLAQTYHPDVMPESRAGAERMKLINEAYAAPGV